MTLLLLMMLLLLLVSAALLTDGANPDGVDMENELHFSSDIVNMSMLIHTRCDGSFILNVLGIYPMECEKNWVYCQLSYQNDEANESIVDVEYYSTSINHIIYAYTRSTPYDTMVGLMHTKN